MAATTEPTDTVVDGASSPIEAATGPTPESRWSIFTEDWDPAYGVPAAFEQDASGSFELVEDGPSAIAPIPPRTVPLCFVDGVRRVELSLWAEGATTGARVPGLVGAYAVGGVAIRPGGAARFQGIRLGRLAIWGGGHAGALESRTGYRWVSLSTEKDDLAGLQGELQNRMRSAEGALAIEAADAGWAVVLDGPLGFVRSPRSLIVGYVKTHHRQILPTADHVQVPELDVGWRTRLYASDHGRYTCYVRVGHPGPVGSPWGGIARLELAVDVGLAAAIDHVQHLASLLPRYAGVPHRDPRAPVNLTPVRNLERHLTRLLGPADHARRAARDAVAAGRVA